MKVHKVGDSQFGEFELKVVAPVYKDPNRLRQSITGDRTVTLAGDLCVDGTSPEGQTKMVRKTAFTWTSVDTGIEVDATVTETRQNRAGQAVSAPLPGAARLEAAVEMRPPEDRGDCQR